MEKRGEERDISATQGEGRGDEVNTLKDTLKSSFLFMIFMARSIQHILDLMLSSAWHTNAILALFRWGWVSNLSVFLVQTECIHRLRLVVFVYLFFGQIFTEINHHLANYRIIYKKFLYGSLCLDINIWWLWLLLFCRKSVHIFHSILFASVPKLMCLIDTSHQNIANDTQPYLHIFPNDPSSLLQRDQSLGN